MHYKPKFPWAYVALLLIALSGFCLLHARQPSDAWLISIGFMMGLLAATLAVWVAVRFGD